MLHWGIGSDGRGKLFNSLEPFLPTLIIAALFAGFVGLTVLVQ